ncbi:GNAT family N-acetyltransferase [Pseudovibrio exalbescens]|uniref:Acetyltransferase n=1 Tax=Pseudovibrio exalbescens TaxID=197461 RepID=A0A1U7JDQ8_9HYPH|nr:GNAT family N-acetyltransferase [Pseudovibrio exalbescens]OKL42828.1 acetyltransferase [Pseudovibrio exalbescens]
MTYLHLNADCIGQEHICCAISDKKCAAGYQAKKDWLSEQFTKGYEFVRLDERGKVFIEFGPAEHGWVPLNAPGYLLINCFWVSGRFKGKGHGKALLAKAVEAAKATGKVGLVTVAGKKKFHFMSDGKWFKRQGFEVADSSPWGFELLALKLDEAAGDPSFLAAARAGEGPDDAGLVAYYSARCPFTDLHVNQSLKEAADKRGLPLRIVPLTTQEEAMAAPCPSTVFDLFKDGEFVTTDLSACMDSRFDKVVK